MATTNTAKAATNKEEHATAQTKDLRFSQPLPVTKDTPSSVNLPRYCGVRNVMTLCLPNKQPPGRWTLARGGAGHVAAGHVYMYATLAATPSFVLGTGYSIAAKHTQTANLQTPDSALADSCSGPIH